MGNSYLQSKKDQFNQRFKISLLMDSIRKNDSFLGAQVQQIVDLELANAAQRAVDAGYSGSMGDDGAGAKAEALRNFLDGMVYVMTGETIVYKELIDQINKESDSEYQEYLRLKEKFGE